MAKKNNTKTDSTSTSTSTEAKAPAQPKPTAEQQCRELTSEIEKAVSGAKFELVLDNGKSHLLRDGVAVNKNTNAACLRNFLAGYLAGVIA